MEKRDRKPGYFARLKRRRQLKQSQSEKAMAEQNPSDSSLKTPVISCPSLPAFSDPQERIKPNPPEGLDDSNNMSSQAKKEKRRPPGTVEYTVGPQESLNSIALKFNITPNKLVQLNRLFSRSVYPGQKLFVPDVGQSEAESQSVGSSDPTSIKELSEKVSQDGDFSGRSVRPLRRERSPLSEDENPAIVKFIKMSCKYFTDGMGVVGGVMIVTPNNIMFDPHKSDPLVIEHGCEEYGLICPMEEVVSVALYNDISRMKLKDALPSPGEWEELPSERDLNPFSRYEALDPKRPIVLDDIDSALSEMVIERAECEPADQSPSDEGFTELELPLNGSAEEPMSGSRSPAIATSQDQRGELPGSSSPKQVESQDQSLSDPVPLTSQRGEEEDEGLVQNRSIEETTQSLPVLSETEKDGELLKEKPASLATRQAKDGNSSGQLVNSVSDHSESAMDQNRKLSLSETASGKFSSQEPSPAEERLSEEEKRKRSNKAEVKSWLLERMQAPIQNMLLSTEEKSKTPPMFLCFKVGKPMRKSFIIGRTSSPAHTRGKQPEYWFAVPQERVDHLYAFFVQWSPDVYGKEAREQGFVVVEKDELNMIDNFFSDPKSSRSWEIITINEAKRRQSFGSYEGEEPFGDLLPMLSDPSALLQDTHIEKLACRLPARVQGYPWRLAYSTVEHGTSLKTLYRSLLEVDSPVLLVIKDMDSQLFGGYSTHPFRVSEHCYGTGETFLFSFCPEIKVYRWTGENSYFVKGNIDSLQMGGGGGQIGLWLDADLYHGTTSSCATFHNQPLSTQKDFIIHSVEVWAFE
ncbi:nuclear receptor coactivator 7 isoform X2 [Salmo salar]|uniref:Nuclear receptor coactivator 7 isoform X2 n=1 Tax=Salmo salar TaxID=8030 RepID=A0A1S3MAZ6_SALSA|nr:nuclear receptor coactivator 7-like isoform X2 [Salmo salar]|eukprot:XP_014000146.1 PREDICTED: nuclear receptor coactivator 7-like isoform X2 [Salmo salar]